MKKKIAKMIIIGVLAFAPILMFSQPNPGQNSGGGSVGGNPIGGGSAPLGSGIALLLGLAAAYGGKRVYETRKKLAE